MKLEIKHLAPYLPYGLKVKNENRTYKIITINGFYFSKSELILNSIELNGGISSKEIKPILRPLSDLTKEIKYGLSTYAFIDLFEMGDCDGCIFEFEHGNIKTIKSISSIAQNSSYHDINYLPHAVVNMMVEYHFDVFGLIDAGLAIDINTLTN